MYNSRKKLTTLCAAIFVTLGIWMILSVCCRAAETNNDEKQLQTTEPKLIRVGSFEDTFNYVDKNGVRRGFGYELMPPSLLFLQNHLSLTKYNRYILHDVSSF